MLDDKTLEWLEERGKPSYPATCVRFNKMQHDFDENACKGCALHAVRYLKGCPLATNYKDAAEFEARAQKYLMYQYEKPVRCAEITGGFCPSRDTMLMFARLAVETEMEAEDK